MDERIICHIFSLINREMNDKKPRHKKKVRKNVKNVKSEKTVPRRRKNIPQQQHKKPVETIKPVETVKPVKTVKTVKPVKTVKTTNKTVIKRKNIRQQLHNNQPNNPQKVRRRKRRVIRRRKTYKQPKIGRIVIAVHHKTGARLMRRVFRKLSQQYNFKIEYNMWSKNINLSKDSTRVVHMIRHPFEIITSGYLYHKSDCPEHWCNKLNHPTRADKISYNYNGKTYKQHLRTISLVEGLNVEMNGRSQETLRDMYRWKYYNDSRVLNVKMEDVIHNFDHTFQKIFKHIGVPERRIEKHFLPCIKEFDLSRKSKNTLKKMKHVTNIEQNPMRHKLLWGEDNYKQFYQLFPVDIFEKIGYSLSPP